MCTPRLGEGGGGGAQISQYTGSRAHPVGGPAKLFMGVEKCMKLCGLWMSAVKCKCLCMTA